MRVLMTGGGTAGHINPALAIAEKIRKERPDTEFLFVGAKGRMETQLVPKAGYPIQTVDVRGFKRKLTPANIAYDIGAAYHAVTAGRECSKILKQFQPDVAIGTGGYVSGPILRKAAQMGVPVLVHESNALPGVTIKMLAKYAKGVMIADEAARKYLPDNAPIVVTGNPLRSDFFDWSRERARKELELDDRPMVLSFGGSLGAEHVNEAMLKVLIRSAKDKKIQHIHATGRGGYAAFVKALKAAGVEPQGDTIHVREYIDDMPRCMSAADLVVSRCGAMTLTELPAAQKPSILIPSPYVAENHQYYNAMALVDRGAAVCIEEKDLSGEVLGKAINELVLAPDRLKEMGRNAGKSAILDAADRIYAVVEKTLKKA